MISKWNKFVDDYLPHIWGVMIVVIVTGGLFGATLAIGKWVLKLLGVI